MSDKPSAAWYLAPIFFGIIGSAIMWYVLKDEDHPDSPKMIKKGWVIGIILTVISFAWIPFMLIPFAFMGMGQPQMHQQVPAPMPEPIPRMVQEPIQAVPAPGFQDVPEMIVESSSSKCSGTARCISGTVTQVIDGDTIRIDGQSIRFALASTPELNEFGGIDAKNFVARICPVGSQAIVDEDDGQTEGSYGRIVGVIYCNGVNLNEAVIESGHAYLSGGFCDKSEFSNTAWAQKYGCRTTIETASPVTAQPSTPQSSCDPSYPDFCIPPPPPDLDCKDISSKKFTVLQPDPHRFDGDKDGIGCES